MGFLFFGEMGTKRVSVLTKKECPCRRVVPVCVTCVGKGPGDGKSLHFMGEAGVTFESIITTNGNVLNIFSIIFFRSPCVGAAGGGAEVGGGALSAALSFPFETDSDDHCESPLEAYQDIVPLLQAVADGGKGGGKPKPSRDVRIYDPYYCNGSVVKHLNQLGFPNVHNRLEDCYDVWQNSTRYPDFDVLVTNPPYSSHHMEELIRHLTSTNSKNKKALSIFPSNRPWMLLLPQWVHKKDYYLEATKDIHPFYLVPHKRYVYVPPASFRERKRSDTHKKSSPFVSMWYIWGGTMEQNSRWLELCVAAAAAAARRKGGVGGEPEKRGQFDVARSKSALRDLRRKSRS